MSFQTIWFGCSVISLLLLFIVAIQAILSKKCDWKSLIIVTILMGVSGPLGLVAALLGLGARIERCNLSKRQLNLE